MKHFFIFLFLLIVVFSGIYLYYINSPYSTGIKRTFFGRLESMRITSTTFNNNEAIPAKYTCDGANVNPPLTFNSISTEAKSLILIIEDKDSSPKDFTHWSIFNMNTFANGIDENFVPSEAVEGANDFGDSGYGGPCPPSGTHHYVFKLFALDTNLDLQRGAKKADILSKIEGHIIEEAELVGTYKKQ